MKQDLWSILNNKQPNSTEIREILRSEFYGIDPKFLWKAQVNLEYEYKEIIRKFKQSEKIDILKLLKEMINDFQGEINYIITQLNMKRCQELNLIT